MGVAEPPGGALRRWLLLGLGLATTGLGIVGAFLPVLPTTPFLLVALWAFARSSRRFHDWLFHHRLFGPSLQRFQRERSVPLTVKLVAWGSMAASLAYVGFVVRPRWYAFAPMIAVIVVGAVAVGRLRTTRRAAGGS
jgi:hypothetical protein